jgi:hypothetical protein
MSFVVFRCLIYLFSSLIDSYVNVDGVTCDASATAHAMYGRELVVHDNFARVERKTRSPKASVEDVGNQCSDPTR